MRALGVKHVRTIPAFEVEEIEKTLKEYLKLDEPSVLITQEPCALLPEGRKRWLPLEVIAEKCNGCTLCFRVGCPAILKSDELDAQLQRPQAVIDAGAVHRLRGVRPGLPAGRHCLPARQPASTNRRVVQA